MQIKFILTADGVEHELGPDCVKNWDDIKCTWKRKDFSGIVRSFTSKFEFVNAAYDILLDQFQRFETEAQVTIGMLAINNQWGWDKVFECPLDFSTYHEQKGCIKLSATDNSIDALIKANKSTKYEFEIGTDINPDGHMVFKRIPMNESVTYAITCGESQDDGSLIVDLDDRIPTDYVNDVYDTDYTFIGVVGEEIYVNGAVHYTDDQSEQQDYCIKAFKDVSLKLDASMAYDRRFYQHAYAPGFSITVLHKNALNNVTTQTLFFCSSIGTCVGNYASEEALREAYPRMLNVNGANQYAVINGIVYSLIRNFDLVWDGNTYEISSTGQREDFYKRHEMSSTMSFDLHAGDELKFKMSGSVKQLKIYESSIKFSWKAVGAPVSLQTFRVKNVLKHITGKLLGGMEHGVVISGHDPRIANTLIMAAESVRDIQGAKLYSSFNDFCEWMEAVFGYTYYIKLLPYNSVKRFQAIVPDEAEPYFEYSESRYAGDVSSEHIGYIKSLGRFVLLEEGVFYSDFDGCDEYNDMNPSSLNYMKARKETLFVGKDDDLNDFAMLFEESTETGAINHEPFIFILENEPSSCTSPMSIICFVHRSELFSANAQVKVIGEVQDVSYDVNSSIIYASAIVGYEKKDYNSMNGREEFNFNIEYTTGSTVSEKKLQLKSKYRADVYGLEFAVQKRGKSTTDSESDHDVFFVYDTSIPPLPAYLVDFPYVHLFNGAFSPMACVKANEGYIGAQAETLRLAFASSTGNSDLSIGNVPLNSDVTLNNRLFTAGRLSFSTNDLLQPEDINGLIQVTDNGITYIGYISELEIRLGKQQAAKYKLIVKSRTIEQ